jgi:hypothetical protein
MSDFDKLMKDPRVAGHPLLKNSMKKWSDSEFHGLNDMFSSNNPYKRESKKDLTNLVKDATLAVQDMLDQFDTPMMPQIRFLNHRDTKYARNDETRVVSSVLSFDVEFMTLTGVKRVASVPVTVRESEVIPPSIMYVNGAAEVISQGVIDGIIGRATSYALPSVREGYEPLLNGPEREMAVKVRNERGWVENGTAYKNYLMRKNMKRKKSQDFGPDDDWTKEAYDFFIEDLAYDAMNRIEKTLKSDDDLKTVSDVLNWMVKNDTLLESNIQNQIVSHKGTMQAIERFSSNFKDDSVKDNYSDEDYYAAVIADVKSKMSKLNKNSNKKKAGMPVPSAYQLVMEDMKKAEKEGKDSFPRAFHHILRNYILNHVATAYKDQWMIPLINDGYCLNPYGTNIRVKSAKTWKDLERSKKAQELEKEVELEVTDKPVDMGEQFYPGTKTPIEISDSVKFGDKKGTVVELMGEHVIVKSKGMEYRVPTEEIEPLPSTFRKMYM